jgi:hypothetical protein
VRLDKHKDILSYMWRGSDYRWYVFQKNADKWFSLAKRNHSTTCFLIASTLAAMEVWDIIGLEQG